MVQFIHKTDLTAEAYISSQGLEEGRPVQATVKKAAGKWYVTIRDKVESPEYEDNILVATVDMNAGQVAVVTDSGNADILQASDRRLLDTRIACNQRRMANQ